MHHKNGDHTIRVVQLRKKMEEVLPYLRIHVEKPRKIPDERLLDFILVYSKVDKGNKHSDFEFSGKRAIIELYLRNLYSIGFNVERTVASFDENIVFVKLYGAKSMLKNFAKIYDISLTCDNLHYSSDRNRFFKRFACKVNSITPDDPLYERAPESLSERSPKDITMAERIMITYQILRVTGFGIEHNEQGIAHLLEREIFIAAYPLHDETMYWTEEGKLSDRQLLYKFWASPKQFWKKQPLNLIEKYFGTEVAFYFAFLGYYTFLLVPPGFLGMICFIYSVCTITSAQNIRSKEICGSDVMICPPCEFFASCKYEELKTNCINANITYILDNKATVTFAVLVSLWATIFTEFWKRHEANLAFRWNVLSVALDTSVRPEYEINCQSRRISPVTEEWESYDRRRVRFSRLFISYGCVLFLILIAIAIVIAVMIYYNAILMVMRASNSKLVREYATVISSVTASCISVICIVSFQQLYIKIVKKLTDLENVRTQVEYNNSYIYKEYILSFLNGYSVAFYIAFFKGRFYTYPGDPARKDKTNMSNDLCCPVGCSINLFIHLVVVLFVKSLFFNALQVVKPFFMSRFRKSRLKKKEGPPVPIWEEQYTLEPLGQFFLVPEYLELALQYGFVIFFTAAFPLAPFLALCHAITSVRVDSYKFLTSYRRPIPTRVPGLEAWAGIFRITTSIGVVVNAFLIAFTLDFIPRQIKDLRTHKTFLDTILSEFDTQDYAKRNNISHPDKCYFRGVRYPPSHPNKYKLSVDFWFELVIRLVFVVIFEHVILALTGILAYAIPDVPDSIKENLNRERMDLTKAELRDKSLVLDDDIQQYVL